MEQLWRETTTLLDAIEQEYTTILQELETTTNHRRVLQLRTMASACVAKYLTAVQLYRAAKQRHQWQHILA
jgi:hypothetical protein